MEQYYGIIFAFLALFCWAFGDLFIQKSVRKTSVIRALFYISISGTIALLPFIWSELWSTLWGQASLLLLVTSVAMFVAGLLDFKAMKDGKISIIEPILSLELPIAVGLSILFWKEILSFGQLFIIFMAFLGIILTMKKKLGREIFQKSTLEAGVLWALGGAITMGLVNFLIGVSSQETSALMAIWYTNAILTILCLIYIVKKREINLIKQDFQDNPGVIGAECILDNLAWLSFALATTFIPISIATTISESYIAMAVLLGVFVNQEKIRPHQAVGIGLTFVSIMVLSYSTI